MSDRLVFVGFPQSLVRSVVLALGVAPVCANAADEPLEMIPSSGWVVDYAEESCALRRAFSGGDHQVVLELRQFSPDPLFQVTVVSDTLSRQRKPPRVRFEPDDEWFEPNSPQFVDTGGRQGILYQDSLRETAVKGLFGPTPGWPDSQRDAREAAITALSVDESFEQDLRLRTGEMHQPMEAMRECYDELLTHWELDADAQRTLSRRVAPVGMVNWVPRIQASYPSNMDRTGQSGRVRIRLIVGPDGKPTSCSVQLHISPPAFEEAACAAAMRYARFEPALDAEGAPIASYYGMTLVF